MTSLYQINFEIEKVYFDHVDTETGEISDEGLAKLAELEPEKEKRVLGLARLLKETAAEQAMVAAVAKERGELASSLKRKCDSMKRAIARSIEKGEKFSDEYASIAWRASKYTQVHDAELLPRGCFVDQDPKVSLDLVKLGIKAGSISEKVATIETRNNLQIT